jgi:hypothetical protein
MTRTQKELKAGFKILDFYNKEEIQKIWDLYNKCPVLKSIYSVWQMMAKVKTHSVKKAIEEIQEASETFTFKTPQEALKFLVKYDATLQLSLSLIIEQDHRTNLCDIDSFQLAYALLSHYVAEELADFENELKYAGFNL